MLAQHDAADDCFEWCARRIALSLSEEATTAHTAADGVNYATPTTLLPRHQ